MVSPFRVTVFDGGMNRLGWIGDPIAVTVTERHNQISTGEVTVRSDHQRMSDLIADGARLTVDYLDESGEVLRRVLSGPVRSLRGQGPSSAGTVTVGVESDARLLSRVLGWPVPGAALGSQTSAYDVRSGAAETVLKGYVTANAVTRLGLPVTVATDQARGGTIKTQARFHPLADVLLEAVEGAGLGVSVVQDDAAQSLVVDVYEPATYPRTLTEQSGVVVDWSWSVQGPTATRVIAGDQGEGAARSFTTTVHTARESMWSDVIEVFRDARDTDDATTLTQRRDDTLAEGAPKRGLRVELAESAGFRYGQGIRVGDTVTVEVGPGVTVTDVLREAVLSWDAQDGLVVTPVVGERSDDPGATIAHAIYALGRAFRHVAGSR